MSSRKKILKAAFAVFCMVSMLFASMNPVMKAQAASNIEFVILSTHSKTLKIGDEYYLLAVTSNGKKPTFKSSDTKVASVNTYGKITAKKAGTVKITAKIRNGEASCTIRVEKTRLVLSAKRISLENGCSARLTVSSSTGHDAVFKSNKKSVAEVDAFGNITAKKPGTAKITATVDKTSASCTVTVRKPTLSLNRTSASLYRKEKIHLEVKSTSKSIPVWKSSKRSVAVVDSEGTVTAVKNGTAVITVTVDGVKKSCEVTVKKPTVQFEENEITLSVGQKRTVNVQVSSGNKPVFSSSNSCVAEVDKRGCVTAKDVGKAYIYASEDGVRSRVRIVVK
ncbi:Ig-like domain-containing protein [Lachnospiraceae bacterium 46-15]